MRHNGNGGVVKVMTLFVSCVLIASLALPAQSGRPQPVVASNSVTTVTNSTSLIGSKIHIILCIKGTCDFFGNG
ncbi:unnamed protein product [Urochloa humidicola]